jgi:predicted DNA-binding transcriptional regulator YafY
VAERPTTREQLTRLLYLIPAAAREGGARLDELAAALDADPRDVVRDLEEVCTRTFYHPSGSGDDIQVAIEPDRVQVWTKGEFRRPTRLSPGETLALGLGLRSLAADQAPARRAETLALARRLEAALGAAAAPDAAAPDAASLLAVRPGDEPAGELWERIVDAARERRRCRIRYLKPAAKEPEERTIEPYVVLLAEGRRYLVAHCRGSDGMRVFRVDRIVGLALEEERFEVPAGFDPRAYVTNGIVYRAEVEVPVRVRYSPRIARWIREKGPVEEGPDGSVEVTHRVADPHWAVRHVLQYGPDAEVLDPPELRERVRRVAARIADAADGG